MKIEKLNQKSSIAFKYISILYLFLGAYYFLGLSSGGGDEVLFINDLQLLKNVGWSEAVVKNISIPYLLLAYPFSLVMEGYKALRLVNIILYVLLLVYFYYFSNIKSKPLYFYLFFFSSTVGYFYFGTNDLLFFIGLIVFFNEVNNAINGKTINGNLAISALIISFFTRELFIVYLPVIVLGLYILYKKGFSYSKKIFIPIGIFILFLVLNSPSIEKNGALSYDKKSPPKGISVSWSQRQYLAQLLVNRGELENGQHPSWDETEKYIEKNGKDSLPDGIFNGVTFDLPLTIKEFFKDLIYSMIYSFRSLGFMLLIALGYYFKQIKMKKIAELKYFVPFATLSMLIIFSLIIISYVELRWLMPVFIMTLVYYSELEFQNKISKHLVLINYVALCLFSIYGMFRILNKI